MRGLVAQGFMVDSSRILMATTRQALPAAAPSTAAGCLIKLPTLMPLRYQLVVQVPVGTNPIRLIADSARVSNRFPHGTLYLPQC